LKDQLFQVNARKHTWLMFFLNYRYEILIITTVIFTRMEGCSKNTSSFALDIYAVTVLLRA